MSIAPRLSDWIEQPAGQARLAALATATPLPAMVMVAVLGTIDDFIPPLQLEATRQGVDTAPLVVWLSDGGRGFWRVYRTCFATAIAVLDVFHAASHLARATQALFDTLTSAALQGRWHALERGGL